MTTNGQTSSVDVPSGIDFLWLELTRKCNLECRHCYAESGPHVPLSEGMSADDWHRVIDEAAEVGCSSVQFIGGEPTLHPAFEALVDRAARLGFRRIEVFTNATRLDDRRCAFFAERGVRVATSFYSHLPAVHDFITGRHGSHDRTVAGIRRALAHGLRLRVGVIVHQANAGHVEETTRFLRDLGVENIGYDDVRGVGRGTGETKRPSEDPYDALCGACWQGKLAVTPDGTAYPCVFSRFCPVGNVREEPLARLVGSSELMVFRKHVANRKGVLTECRPDDQCSPYVSCSPSCAPSDKCWPDYNCNPYCKPGCNPGCSPSD